MGAMGDDANVICVVVHGRGQTQDDMVRSIVNRIDLADVHFVLPKSDGAAWYDARAIDPLTDQTRQDMHFGVNGIADEIRAAQKRLPGRPVLLCSFSQGACMSVELLMCQPDLVDAACLLTGCRIGAETDQLPVGLLPNMPIYASCGDKDPWIPADAFFRMLGHLTQSGARLRSDIFPSREHGVSDAEIAVVSEFLTHLSAQTHLLTKAQNVSA